MRPSLTDTILERIGAIEFYARYTKLSKVSAKGECKGLCPLHQEKTPSFFVNATTGEFHCFGCGRGGGPVQFYAFHRGMTVQQAKAELSQELNLNRSCQASGSLRRSGRAGSGSPRQNRANEKIQGEHCEDSDIYAALLDSGQPLPDEVISYFHSRAIGEETLSRFQVSYLRNPANIARQLQDRFDPERLLASGIFRSNGQMPPVFQFLNHPILFPIHRERQPVFVQGRVFREPKGRLSKYCNLANVAVPALLNLDTIKELEPGTPVFLCEGAPDTMTLAQQGFHAVGIIGSSGFKEEWVPDLAGFKVYLLLDNDEAGRAGTEKIIRLFHRNNLPVSIIGLPDDVKDVNDFFLKYRTEHFQQLVSGASEQAVDLCKAVRGFLERVADRSDKFSYPELAEHIYGWFENHGGVFAVNQEQRCFLMFEQVMHEIANNDPFNALMFSKTQLVPEQYQGKMIWRMLRNLCFLRGRREENLAWVHTDEAQGVIYVNLHNSANEVLKLGPGETGILPNGSNEAGVMLGTADKMRGIAFDRTVHPREAVELYQKLVLEPLPCEPENRLFVGCWILTAFFLDYTTDKALLKLSGHTGSGKTTAARVLSCLLYGADYVESATVAYYYADAARNPYLICDNLETENMNREVIQFLLHVATGIHKGKRKAGTDSETVRECANALVAITAIEPLTKPELINRTYDVEFRSIFKRAGFMQREHLERLTRERNRILSGLFLLFSREVMPGLQSQRQEILQKIEVLHPQHSKHRVDSFLTLMVVILKALLKMLEPGQDRTWEIVGWWIRYQGRLAEETERDTNVAVYLLDALAKEMLAQEADFTKEYYLDFHKVRNGSEEPKEIQFVASSRDLLMALQILSKNKGFKLPFSNTQQLGVRLANESTVLDKAGWSWDREKVVRGMRYHRFVKRLG